MSPTDPRLIPRVLTVVATMLLVAGVIAMHSLMVGHASMAQPGPTSAAAPQHAMVTTGHARAPAAEQIQRVAALPASAAMASLGALTGLTSATASDMSAMCLAVLPALVLLLALAFLRLRRRQSMVPSRRGVPRQWVGIRASPRRRTTPSLAQLCVLRA